MNKKSKMIFEKLYETYPSLCCCSNEINLAFELMKSCLEQGGKILVCGNGGSACDSEHIVGELMKGFNLRRPLTPAQKARFAELEDGDCIADRLQGALRAISLTSQAGLITAFANDVDAELIFAQQVFAYADECDILIALSTSGNSKNIVLAAKTAKAVKTKAIAITGSSGGRLDSISDCCIKLPACSPYEVQEFTLPVYHALCAALELEFFES